MSVLSAYVRRIIQSAAISTLIVSSPYAVADGKTDCPANTYLAGGYSKVSLLNMIEAAALETELVPSKLAISIAEEASGVRPEWIGQDCRIGLFQLSGDDVERRFGVTPNQLLDPNINTRLGMVLLADYHRENGGDWKAAAQKLTGRDDLFLYATVSSPGRSTPIMRAQYTIDDDAPGAGRPYRYTRETEPIMIEWLETPAERRNARLSAARLNFRTALLEKMQQDQRAANAWPKRYRYD